MIEKIRWVLNFSNFNYVCQLCWSSIKQLKSFTEFLISLAQAIQIHLLFVSHGFFDLKSDVSRFKKIEEKKISLG